MRLRVVDKLLAWGADINLAGGPRVATPLQIAVVVVMLTWRHT